MGEKAKKQKKEKSVDGDDKKKKKAKKKAKADEEGREAEATTDKKAKKKSKKDATTDEEGGVAEATTDKKAKKEKKKDGPDKKEKKEKKAKKEKKVKKEKKKKDKKAKKKKKDKKAKKDKKSKKDKKKDKASKDKKKDKKKLVVEIVCCICKDKDVEASAGGLCQHVFCTPCLENLLHKPMQDPQLDDNHLAAPTLGRCPECRTELRKFDMKKPESDELLYERNTNLAESPIHGKVFRPKDVHMQLGNFCFDEETPYMSFQDAIDKDADLWLLNDGTKVPEFKDFVDGFHYDIRTRTFHGSIMWDQVHFQGAHRWDVVLSFNKDSTEIHVGLIHEHKERILTKKEIDKVSDGQLYRHQYPLDGEWKLIWLNASGGQQTGNITVRNNEFQQGPFLFNLNFEDPEKPRFRWPLDPVLAAAKSGVNLKKKPMGPKVGEQIVWETTHPAFSEITWERETIGEMPIQRTIHFGPGDNEYTSEEPKEEEEEEEEEETAVAAEKEENQESEGSESSNSTNGSGGSNNAEKADENEKNDDGDSSGSESEKEENEKQAVEDSDESEKEEEKKPPATTLPAAKAKDDSDSSGSGSGSDSDSGSSSDSSGSDSDGSSSGSGSDSDSSDSS